MNQLLEAVGTTVDQFAEQLALVLVVVAGVAIYLIRRRQWQQATALKRLETVISPIFEMIEPYLFRDPPVLPPEKTEMILDYIEDHQPLAGGILRGYAWELGHIKRELIAGGEKTKLKATKEYGSVMHGLFRYIDSEYDRLATIAGIPRRAFRLRAKYQFPYGWAHPLSSLLGIVMLTVFLLAAALGMVFLKQWLLGLGVTAAVGLVLRLLVLVVFARGLLSGGCLD